MNMAWMSEAAYELQQDCMNKKHTARSARSTRTHCGKSGAVKFPSDYLTKKEREAMNGECKSYRLNDPITYKEFKKWPDEHNNTHTQVVRSKYYVPDRVLAEAMGVSQQTMSRVTRDLGIGPGKKTGAAARKWFGTEDEKSFRAWWYGEKVEAIKEAAVDECVTDELIAVNDEPEIEIVEDDTCDRHCDASENATSDNRSICNNPYHYIPVIPSTGTMTFVNNRADDILGTIKSILCDSRVNVTISWEFVSGE